MLIQHVRAALAALLTVTIASCSIPDGDDVSGFVNKIHLLDPGAHAAARIAEARSRAINALSGLDPDDHAGDLECKDDLGGAVLRVPVKKILDCLTAAPGATFDSCVKSLVSDFKREWTEAGPLHSNAWCRFVPSGTVGVDPKWDPDQITDEDLARTAFASPEGPPAWMIAAGVVAIGVGGVFVFASGWAVVLCPLDLGYGCPGDPLAPGETPAPGGSSGGDR